MSGAETHVAHWGAVLDRQGHARFRLWAPAREAVSVETEAGLVAMEDAGGGWFEAEVGDLAPDTAYTFVLDGGERVPDPAARAQMDEIHGPSRLVDLGRYEWKTPGWRGRPWHEAVIYELHVGTFTREGSFAAAAEKLDHLAKLGVTAVELMPVAQFGGKRGWGYDGVLHYAPHSAYGGPEGLMAFVDAAHQRGLMVLLDVVYNHFGPDGNYLHLYAPGFFDENRHTPWGAAIAYEKPPVRQYFVENALYWLEQYKLDGFRFDAIDQILDPSDTHILEEIAAVIRDRITNREIHLTTEDLRNIVRLHERDEKGGVRLFTAEWNDDFHNVAHVIATGESEGYYQDFVDGLEAKLARALAEGYIYQGEHSQYLGRSRGEPSVSLPPIAFVDFLQNHDQTGNRACGERLIALAERPVLEALTAVILLSPCAPLLFMGEEWGEKNPFLYFTDFHGDLAKAVRDGRRREFAAWSAFRDSEDRAKIPDPNAPETMAASRIDWTRCDSEEGAAWLAFYRQLLEIRAREITPLLARARGGQGRVRRARDGVVAVSWDFKDGTLHLDANLSGEDRPALSNPDGELIFAHPADARQRAEEGILPAYTVLAARAPAGSADALR